MTTCQYEKNLAKLREVDMSRRARASTSAEYRTGWEEFWIVARGIEPCRCDKCEADRVLREMTPGDRVVGLLENLAMNGYGALK